PRARRSRRGAGDDRRGHRAERPGLGPGRGVPARAGAERSCPPDRRQAVRPRAAAGGRVKGAMAKRSLVIVESPTKVKTIQKYLDSKYIVKASMGHIRDLPKSKL